MTHPSNITLDNLTTAPSFFYLSSPYNGFTGSRQAAFREACVATARLLEAGVPVFCPIAHSHFIAEHLEPLDDNEEHDFWMKADAPFMQWATGIIVLTLPGWKESRGVAQEIAYFEDVGKTVVYLDPVTFEVTQ